MADLFAVAISAENAARYEIMAGAVLADDASSAKKLGLDAAEKHWSTAGGWENHACSVDRVPLEIPSRSSSFNSDAIARNRVVVQAVEKLSKTNPANVQEVVASQVELLAIYHNLALDQARQSFKWALIAAGIGTLFFIVAVAVIILRQPQDMAIISVISGALIEVISGINFYLYNKSSAQLSVFQTRLDTMQRFLLANSVCEGLDGVEKQQARSQLVSAIAGRQPLMNVLEDNANMPNLQKQS